MNYHQKHLSASLIALAALFSTAWAQAATAPALGTASGYSVVGGTAVTTTTSTINGDVASATAATFSTTTINGKLIYTGTLTLNFPSTITGGSTESNTIPAQAVTDLNTAWTKVQSIPCTDTTTLASATITGPLTLGPGVYCTSTALTGAGVLTLDAGGDPSAVWIFKIGGALTGNGFSVLMTNGGQPCNVFWVPGADVTMNYSAFSGNILAGSSAAAGGSITLNYATLAGRALANTAVTMTGGNVIGCSALPGPSSSCKGEEHKEHKKCNQGVGNGPEDGCDPGNSNLHNPFGSNDENGGTPGNPGRKGGNK